MTEKISRLPASLDGSKFNFFHQTIAHVKIFQLYLNPFFKIFPLEKVTATAQGCPSGL